MLHAPPRKLHQFPLVRSYMTPTTRETRPEDVMASDCLAAPPNAPLAEVVSEMAKRQLGRAVIVEGGRCVGIFTSNDALVALSELLSEPA
jgi:acetoin utilization protein AcuB